MTALERKIAQDVNHHWSYIEHVFDFRPKGDKLNPKEATELLWSEFQAKTRNLTNPVVLTAELEILDPMPYEATVYRKEKGQWQRLNVQGMTPLTVHIVGEVEYNYEGPDGKKDKGTVIIFHRFIGKTFPQYASSR
jgi:hypothetical protein